MALSTSKGHWQDLPFELLARIFTISAYAARVVVQPDVSCAPWLLCHVCGWWRKVALDCPQIWQYLNIHVKTFRVPLREVENEIFIFPHLLDLVSWWWVNAKEQPMFLCIRKPATLVDNDDNNNGDDDNDDSNLRRAMVSFNVKKHRLTRLEKFFQAPIVLSARVLHLADSNNTGTRYVGSASAQFPNLESVTISDVDEGFETRLEFAAAPRLRYIHLATSTFTHPNSFMFPTDQVTHLFISGQITCKNLRRLLSNQFPNLLVGGFDIGKPDRSDLDYISRVVNIERVNMPPLQVTTLQQLTLAGNSINPVSSPVLGLAFPSLTALRIAQFEVEGVSEDIAQRIEDFTSRMPKLVELHLPSSLLCLLFGGPPRLLFDPSRPPIGYKRRFLEHLVLEISFAITDDRIPCLLQLVQSTWIHPASGLVGGRVTVEVQDNSMTFSYNPKAEVKFIEKVVALRDDTSSFDLDVVRSRRNNWTWRNLPEDLSHWRDAVGFYETLHV